MKSVIKCPMEEL